MVTGVQLKNIDPTELFLERIPKETKKAFLACIELPIFKKSEWYLAGGTALALQVGHRKSVDLDFFTTENKFSENTVERLLLETGAWNSSYREAGTIYGTLLKAKMSLIAYPFFTPSNSSLKCGTVRLLTPHDIAVMKIVAISQRGRKRDFLDLFWYINYYEDIKNPNANSLQEVILRTLKQYSGQEHNLPHILKSLTYFDDADHDPMPELYFKASWKQIKQYFQREIPIITRQLLKLP